MTLLKSDQDLSLMKPACSAAARVLDKLGKLIKPGITTRQIDLHARELIQAMGAQSAFLGYKGFPGCVCISVNDEVVHGIGSDRSLGFGDIVSVDCGVLLNGFVGDTAKTFVVGGCSAETQKLLDVTEKALQLGIEQARCGNRISDISKAIQSCVEASKFSVVRDFVGHGVGRSIHEDPQIPNFFSPGRSVRIKKGMTLAIEPMVNFGKAQVKILNDGWTVATKDGSLSAHFEHTVLVTDGDPEILTVS